MLEPTLEDTFWSHVPITSDDKCWWWAGRTFPEPKNYGYFRFKKRQYAAHRVSLELKLKRPLVGAEQALHSCDHAKCVNPLHLFVGSAQDNVADKMAKGRHRVPRGEDVGIAKLTPTLVKKIRYLRECGLSFETIAERFQIHYTTASRIVTRLTWKHVS